MQEQIYSFKNQAFQKIRSKLLLILTFILCTSCGASNLLEENLSPTNINYVSPNFGDSKPVDIKGRKPNTYAIHGVDTSWHNKEINWNAAKKAGVRFVFMKSTEGKDDVDRSFKKNWAAAAKAGILRSAYHFYYFCASPEAQAANYIRTVPKSASSLPPVVDLEWNPFSPTCTIRPPKQKVIRQVKTFLDIIEKHYQQKPIIYTNLEFYRDNLTDGSLPNYTYWLRSVTAQPHLKYGTRPWVFWQYSGTGRAPGFIGDVDLNVFNGSEAQWNAWVNQNSR